MRQQKRNVNSTPKSDHAALHEGQHGGEERLRPTAPSRNLINSRSRTVSCSTPNRRLEQRQKKQNVLTPKCLQFIQHANNSETNANEFMSLVLDIHVCYLRQTTDPHMFNCTTKSINDTTQTANWTILSHKKFHANNLFCSNCKLDQ